MARITGTGSTLEISTDGGSTYQEIECITSVTNGLATDMVDASSNCDNGYKKKLHGDKMATLSVDFSYNNSTGQRMLYTAWANDTIAKYRFREEVLAGAPEYIFDALIASIDDTSPHADVVTASASLESDGVITRQNQT